MWILIASVLASFNINKSKDKDGNDIEINPNFFDLGLTRCVITYFSWLLYFLTYSFSIKHEKQIWVFICRPIPRSSEIDWSRCDLIGLECMGELATFGPVQVSIICVVKRAFCNDDNWPISDNLDSYWKLTVIVDWTLADVNWPVSTTVDWYTTWQCQTDTKEIYYVCHEQDEQNRFSRVNLTELRVSPFHILSVLQTPLERGIWIVQCRINLLPRSRRLRDCSQAAACGSAVTIPLWKRKPATFQ